MSDDADLDRLIDCSGLLGLAVRDEWREGVRANLRVTFRLAALVAEFPLPDEAEPAPVFVA